MESLEVGTIFACILALAILIAFVLYTWIKWRRSQINGLQEERSKDPENDQFKHTSNDVHNYSHAVSMNSVDDLVDKTVITATEGRHDKERKVSTGSDCYPYKGKKRGDSFRDTRTQQETTYL